MVAGIRDHQIYESLVPLGVCPLVLTGMDTTLLYQAAAASAERAIASNQATRQHHAMS
jgi:hypothetical protein